MTTSWLERMFPGLRREREAGGAPPPPPKPPPRPALSAELDAYAQALDGLRDGEAHGLLPVLLARDGVAAAQAGASPLAPPQARRLIELDARLRERAARMPLDALVDWRQTLAPPPSAWWWRLDEPAAAREQQRDLLWVILTGTFTLLTAALATEILTRLWDGAPDTLSVFGSLLTLTLTASPLVKRGRELGAWMVAHVLKFKLRYRAEAMAGMAAFAFVIVLAGRLLLPSLGRAYNNQGFAALRTGDLAAARSKFQRAVALAPDLAVPYYNLADVYRRIGRPDEAESWYQRAIEHDLNYALAYRGLGHLYNSQSEHEQAEAVLLAGLSYLDEPAGGAPVLESVPAKEEIVARYTLLADLGWAYFAQERYALAQEALEAAIAREEALKAFEQAEGVRYRLPLPHYYLAQVYERLERPREAYRQWEDCLRLLGQGWEYNEWRMIAIARLDALEEELQ